MTREEVLRRPTALIAAAALTFVTAAAAGVWEPPAFANVIVLERSPASDAAERAVARLGGNVGADLRLIGGFAARVPSAGLPKLASVPEVRALLPDITFRLNGTGSGPSVASVYTRTVDAPSAWSAGYRGKGINVAVLDSGVAPMGDLVKPSNRIVGWKDFVGGSATPRDPHGHGTYVAGIIAGNGWLSYGKWKGIAPEAGLVGIRVFDALGTSTASRVIQGIQWAVANRVSKSIRVLNMAFSTNSDLSYKLDAVAYAAEQAWKAGIVVVASAGNQGPLPGTVLSPGFDPYVITVGATDDKATASRADDTMASFSGAGPTRLDGISKPDLVAPGVWDTGLRVPGSIIDLQHALSVRDTYYFDGSGTSPAVGVASGVVALVLQRRPSLVPDQVKYVLKRTATRAPSSDPNVAGAGYVNAYYATLSTFITRDNQGLVPAIGGGLLTALVVPDVKWRG